MTAYNYARIMVVHLKPYCFNFYDVMQSRKPLFRHVLGYTVNPHIEAHVDMIQFLIVFKNTDLIEYEHNTKALFIS